MKIDNLRYRAEHNINTIVSNPGVSNLLQDSILLLKTVHIAVERAVEMDGLHSTRKRLVFERQHIK